MKKIQTIVKGVSVFIFMHILFNQTRATFFGLGSGIFSPMTGSGYGVPQHRPSYQAPIPVRPLSNQYNSQVTPAVINDGNTGISTQENLSDSLSPSLNGENSGDDELSNLDKEIELVNQKLIMQREQNIRSVRKMKRLQKLRQMRSQKSLSGSEVSCNNHLSQLVGDIFIGNEIVPDILDETPPYPLSLTYRTVRTYPGMRLTAEVTKSRPMLNWPVEEGSLYTVIISNLDINSRQNRSLAEYWHWFVTNIDGDNVDTGEEIFELLHPLVLPEGNGNHRFGYFVLKQPGVEPMDFSLEGGPTNKCSPSMTNGRGPKRSTKSFMKKYNMELIAATFLILDTSPGSIKIACEWRNCMGNNVFLPNLTCPSQ